MTAPVINTDIAIIGGGVAGLWTLNQLRNAGYSAVLFEQEALGGYQTVGSQGMIHGGIKYALSGALSGSSEAISDMPEIWRQCLHGGGKVDLQGCKVLSEDFFLWSSDTLQSRVSSFFASKLLRGRVNRLAPAEYPAPLQYPQFSGQVYRLVDLVLDVPSLVATLAANHREAIFNIDWSSSKLVNNRGAAILQTPAGEVHAQRLVLTAGTGNERLVQALGGSSPAMQRRPLQQVLMKHQYPEPFFAHCTGGGANPRLTISSHRTSKDEPVWYLGGDLATDGANDDPEQLIAKAKAEISELMPWIDFGHTEWATIRLDRAEPKQSALLRPDTAFVGAVDSVANTLAAWPTKLTLSPNLANEIEDILHQQGITPKHQPDYHLLSALGQPPIAATFWDSLL
jgi:glycerol-3-phosphate dehydrogenase